MAPTTARRQRCAIDQRTACSCASLSEKLARADGRRWTFAACARRLLRYNVCCAADATQEAIDQIWGAIGEYVSERVAAQKGVELPGLGLLTVLKPAPSSVSSKQRVPVFIVDKGFAKRFDVEQTGAIPRSRASTISPTLPSCARRRCD
jgi:hypothetical protein